MNEIQSVIEHSYAEGQRTLAVLLKPMVDEITNLADGIMFEYGEEVDANCESILELCDQIDYWIRKAMR